jgi:hypothetical protein
MSIVQIIKLYSFGSWILLSSSGTKGGIIWTMDKVQKNILKRSIVRNLQISTKINYRSIIRFVGKEDVWTPQFVDI